MQPDRVTRCLEDLFAQRVSLPVRRWAGVSGCPGVTVSSPRWPADRARNGHALASASLWSVVSCPGHPHAEWPASTFCAGTGSAAWSTNTSRSHGG